ncbi:mechanosensitive ion channel [Arenibacter latericius]|uniref:mechanosensitive ion channel n=1 Tax=Arenibacter latericius TaxID=86104 RepID=UPI00040B3942|nr:mechanosensitive ion channel [Arenibacter latericius]MDX1364400.1 mechanosensitive ion channel [Arenibacter latericius]
METQLQRFADTVTDYLPNLLGAILVLLIGWIIAKFFQKLITKLLDRTKLGNKVMDEEHSKSTSHFFGKIVYYLIMVIVLLMTLEILEVSAVLDPLKNMLNKFLAFIPNLIGAVLIGFIGYLLAKFVSSLISMGGNFIDKLIDKTGFKDTDMLVNILQKVVFIIIFIPFLIQAFNALQMNAISEPANEILYKFTDLIGEIIIAALILIIFIWGGKYLASFLSDLFKSLGLDKAAEKIKIQNMIGANQSLSTLLANLIYFFIVFFGVITAVAILGLDQLTYILNEILAVTGQILFGLVIIAIGNYISMIIYNTMKESNNNNFIAGVVRAASLALFIAIALRTMGIANEIVELAFGLILGAIAVAVALSYGLGGRAAAGEHFKEIIDKMRDKTSSQLPANKSKDNKEGDRPV